MWRESAFTKNMDECGRLAEGEDKRHVPTVPNQRCRAEEATVPLRSDCANVSEGRGIKKISTSGWKPFLSPNTKRPHHTPKERVTAHDDGFEMLYWSGFCAEWLWQQFGVWRQEKKKKKFWVLWALLIELKVLPSDSSWCRVKTATKPSLSFKI